jgi:hypothetical protein
MAVRKRIGHCPKQQDGGHDHESAPRDNDFENGSDDRRHKRKDSKVVPPTPFLPPEQERKRGEREQYAYRQYAYFAFHFGLEKQDYCRQR